MTIMQFSFLKCALKLEHHLASMQMFFYDADMVRSVVLLYWLSCIEVVYIHDLPKHRNIQLILCILVTSH
jgi:hypothetical protein